jgi:DNA-binding winged helix-turn-helix (wHTH) protein
MSEKQRVVYEFGPFRLDEGERRLLRGGEEVVLRVKGREERLRPKAFDLLLALLKRAGRMVERGELLEELWPGTFVEDNRLSDNVSTLRKFLGDRAKAPLYIETVPKHGYRFVAEVRETCEGESAPAPPPAFASGAGEARAPKFGLVGSGVNAAGGRAAPRPRPARATCCPPKSFAFAAAFALAGLLAFATYYALNGVPRETAGRHAAQAGHAR